MLSTYYRNLPNQQYPPRKFTRPTIPTTEIYPRPTIPTTEIYPRPTIPTTEIYTTNNIHGGNLSDQQYPPRKFTRPTIPTTEIYPTDNAHYGHLPARRYPTNCYFLVNLSRIKCSYFSFHFVKNSTIVFLLYSYISFLCFNSYSSKD